LADRVQVDEATLLVLCLMEKLRTKTQNLGAVRLLEPFLTTKDVEEILAMHKQKIMEGRGERESGLLVPPGSAT
jgi:hypothetical protein